MNEYMTEEDNMRMQTITDNFGEKCTEGAEEEVTERMASEDRALSGNDLEKTPSEDETGKETAAEGGTREEEPVRHRKGLNNDGVGVIEIILILVVLVTLVLIFKNQLTSIVERAMAALEKSMDKILG